MPAKAGIQYAVLFRVNHKRRGILDHPLSRMMTDAIERLSARRHFSR
jgi:hypothetical protein